MIVCWYPKTSAVEFAKDWLLLSKPGSVLTMTISPDKFEDCCVTCATEELLEDTDWVKGMIFSKQRMNIYKKTIQVG